MSIWKVGLKDKRQPFRNICGEISTDGPLVIFTRQDGRKMMVSASYVTTIEETNLDEINAHRKYRDLPPVSEEGLLPSPRSSFRHESQS